MERMEGRVRRHGRVFPERTRMRSEQMPLPTKQQQQQQQQEEEEGEEGHREKQLIEIGRKIPVVYYLCRNRHLEHPHFIEVPLSSPQGLYLRDVINRLNVLRGKGMAVMYSWSCKRSYKNGFVWHDLSEDDLILPANENEYILKGSELLDSSPSDLRCQIPINIPKLQNGNSKQLNHLENQLPSRSQESSPCSSGTNQQQPSHPLPQPQSPSRPMLPLHGAIQEDEFSPSTIGLSSSSGNASTSSSKRNSPRGSEESHLPILTNHRVHQSNSAVDASTQTEERIGVERRATLRRETCTRGMPTDDGSHLDERHSNQASKLNDNCEIIDDEIPLPGITSSKSSFGGKTDTLESLMRSEVRKMNSFRILEEEDVLIPMGSKIKATNVLMQLITCGSISVKDQHSFGFVRTYRPRFSQNFLSPMFGGSALGEELDYLSENPRLVGLRLEDKEYFSGSIVETKKLEKVEGGNGPALKRSSSYNADRTCKSLDPPVENEQEVHSSRLKCLPRALKIASSKVSKSESMRSPNSEAPRFSSEGQDHASLCPSKVNSKRFTDAISGKGSTSILESFKEDINNVIKIEERLASGARVIIQSTAPCNDSDGRSSS